MDKHYETLGLKTTASRADIEKAYQKLSKKFHPDNNDGDKYFSELFMDIEKAYKALTSRDENVNAVNQKSIKKNNSNPEGLEIQNPEIIYFEANKDSFVEGDTIEIIWKTRNADKVTIKPFGELKTSGTRLFKLKNFNKPELKIRLDAYNERLDKTISRTVILKNEVAEVDFSDFEEEDPVEENKTEENQELRIEKEPIYSNSFAGTASFESAEMEVAKSEESFFSTSGRLRRRSYIGRAFLLGIPAVIASSIVEDSYNDAAIGWSAVVMIVCSILIFIQFIKRLHDINLSGWYGLINFIPYLGILFGLVVIFIDGSKGENNYGPDPKNKS